MWLARPEGRLPWALFAALALAAPACDAAPAPTGAATQPAATGEAPSDPSRGAESETDVAGGGTGGDDAAGAEAPPPAGMIAIPAGIYLMGSPEGASLEERPMHEVIVPALYADLTEVTHGAYRTCADAGACAPPKQDNPFCNARATDRDDHPVNCIRWDDAAAYCAFVGKRLPTEREWEYLARGGAERRSFSWGEEPASPTLACYMHTGTCKVASFPAGAFGLFDVSGNVWEWTASWYGPYPEEHATGQFRVYRGGSWSRRFPKWLRNELRNRYRPEETSAALGVRCVQTKLPLECPPQTAADGERCVRTEGDVLCEQGRRFDGETCVLDVAQALAGSPSKGTTSASASAGGAAPSATQDPDAPITRSRTPEHDADCQRNWPATPAAYRWDGGTFHSRNPVIAAAGCQKRDMGRTWTSACCRG